MIKYVTMCLKIILDKWRKITINRVAKRTQHVASNNVAMCCIEMLRSFWPGLKMSSIGDRLQEVPYESLDHIGPLVFSIWQLQRLTPCFKTRVQKFYSFKKSKYGTSNWEISVSCIIQGWCNNTFFIQFLLYCLSNGCWQEIKNFNLLALKVVAVPYKRWSLTRDSKQCFHLQLETFGTFENWSLREVVAT